MTKFKLFASALMVAMSVSAFAAENLVCEGLVPRPSNNNCAYGGTFAWTASYSSTMQLFSFEAGTLADYNKLKITGLKNATGGSSNGQKLRVVYFYKDANDAEQKIEHTFYNTNDKDITLPSGVNGLADHVNDIYEIAIGGCGDAGSVFLNPANIVLSNTETEAQLVCEGLTARPNNNKCSYTANQFTWTANSANTIQLFAFEAGTLSNYKTLELTTSDFDALGEDVTSGDLKYRVIFFAGSTNVKTKSFASTGAKSVVLADELTEEQIANITEIAFGGINSGACTKGLLSINPSDIYLTPKATIPTAIDEAKAAAKAVKIIENGQVVILCDGVRYNVLGQVVK